MTYKIAKEHDFSDYYQTYLHLEGWGEISSRIHFDRSHKDPIHHAIVSDLKETLGSRKYSKLRGSSQVMTIGVLPIIIGKNGNRYSLNGQYLNLAQICNALARVIYKSCFTDSQMELMKVLMNYMNMPENVRYVLENRFPYFFYENFTKIQVRLQVAQIGDDLLAIEISDGVWGEISFKDMNTFANSYVNGKNRGSWKMLSPYDLYSRLLSREPSPSDLKVMTEFLKQNRQQDIVEQRAQELMNDLARQYPDQIKLGIEDKLIVMYVRGRGYDWKLTERTYKNEIQNVSTFVYQPKSGDDTEANWRGPICIDNMARGSSVGDQFAARALALINDTMTTSRVSTIASYLNAKPNEYRIDWDEV